MLDLFPRLFPRGSTRGLMAGVARDVETISNMSGDTFLLSSGDEVSLTSFLESNRSNTLNMPPGDSVDNRSPSYAAVAAQGAAVAAQGADVAAQATATDESAAGRPAYYRNEQYLSNFERQNFHRDNVTPERPCTAYFNSDTFASSNEVFETLATQGFDPRAIRCLQRKPSGDMLISFATQDVKRMFVRRNVMQIGGRSYAINDRDQPLTYLNIYDAPYELPDTAIVHRLEAYCEVVFTRRGKFSNDVFNGNRHYRVRIHAPIPSYLRFGKFLVRLSHDGQDHTCRRCNRVGHFANDCPNVFCFNCEELGHMAPDCPHKDRCCICKSEDHRARYCRFSWHRKTPPPSPGHNSPPRPDQQHSASDRAPPPPPSDQQQSDQQQSDQQQSDQQQADPGNRSPPQPDQCLVISDPSPQPDQQQPPVTAREEAQAPPSVSSSPPSQPALDTQGLLIPQGFFDPVETDDDLVIASPPTTDDRDNDTAATNDDDDMDDTDDSDDDDNDDDDDENFDDADDAPPAASKPESASAGNPSFPPGMPESAAASTDTPEPASESQPLLPASDESSPQPQREARYSRSIARRKPAPMPEALVALHRKATAPAPVPSGRVSRDRSPISGAPPDAPPSQSDLGTPDPGPAT